MRSAAVFMRLLIAIVCSCITAASSSAQAPKPLFNGKDLTGWRGDTKLWSVHDGAIVGQTDGKIPANTFLIWDGSASDFELRAKFRLKGGNSGIQYRSKQLKDAGNFVVSGYQADIAADERYTGILYEERGRGILAERGQKIVIGPNGDRFLVGTTGDSARLKAAIKSGEWNDYLIVANGNKLTHSINGLLMIEIVDHQASKRAMDGVIALQLHRGSPMVVEYKDIVLKPLPPGKILAPEETPIPADAKKLK